MKESIHYRGLDEDGFVYVGKWDGMKFIEVRGVIVPSGGRVLAHLDDGQHLLVPDLQGILDYFALTEEIKKHPGRYQ
jgi:hypothetical protein